MNWLQKLIHEKLQEGKSFRQLGKECGINHVSLSQYYKGLEPDGKNLAILGKYFRVNFYDLLELGDNSNKQIPSTNSESVEIRLIAEELKDLSPTEQAEWLWRIRKEKEARKL